MIYLLRHGEIDAGRPKRFIGHTDLPLNENGIRQAIRLRTALAEVRVDAIYTSDLNRAAETARMIAEAHPAAAFHRLPALREICLGQWEERSMIDIRNRFPEAWDARGGDMAGFRPPDGESFADLGERVIPVFDRILHRCGHSAGAVVIVAHAGVNRVILCHLLGMPLGHLFRLGQAYGCLNRIDPRYSPPRVMTMNCPAL